MPNQELFPLYDPELDTTCLNGIKNVLLVYLYEITLICFVYIVFQPLPLQPYMRSTIDRSSLCTGSKTEDTQQLASPKVTTPTKTTPIANNLYCKECKKKFNNDATMQNHLRSAKHLAAVKKATGTGKKAVPQAKPSSTQEGFINPETTESLRLMTNIAELIPKEAELAYLKLSKEFYQQKRPLYMANALTALISLNLVDTDNHWLAQLAMARLYCLYNRQMEMAYDLYLYILEDRWKIKKDDIIKLAKCCDRESATAMMDRCIQLMQDTKTSIPGSLLVEVAGAFAQTNTAVNGSKEQNLAEKISIVLYGLASIGFHDDKKSFELYPMISQIYDSIGLPHCSLDIRFFYADHLMSSSLTAQDSTTAMLLFFSILLISVEKDDYPRIDKIDRRIHSSPNGSLHPELLFLSKIARARRDLDYLTLENELKREMDHLDLGVTNGDTQLLLVGIDNKTRIDYLNRLRNCCMLY
ncbi:hypothetical protein BC941DRAFT_426955 [Chlamydoabsidia padenii]|nr:hypothetical protein BC941DRAFT_426955 [Chlamydoabsidia padenii]